MKQNAKAKEANMAYAKYENKKNTYEKENVYIKSETHGTPEKKFRAGAISATVWKNHGVKDGEIQDYSTITFERSYKDKEGKWQSTNSLRVNDLPKAAVVIQKAYEDLVLREFTDSSVTEEQIRI